ncbi:MAG: hypothetical protein P8Y49_04715 [Sulfurovaceae bacterium]
MRKFFSIVIYVFAAIFTASIVFGSFQDIPHDGNGTNSRLIVIAILTTISIQYAMIVLGSIVGLAAAIGMLKGIKLARTFYVAYSVLALMSLVLLAIAAFLYRKSLKT